MKENLFHAALNSPFLCCGLPVTVTRRVHDGTEGRTYEAIWLGELDGERFVARTRSLGDSVFSPGMEQLGMDSMVYIDLEHPMVTDHIARFLYSRLSSVELEMVTAPRWFEIDGCDGTAWVLARERFNLHREDAFDPEMNPDPDERAVLLVEDEDDPAFGWGRADIDVVWIGEFGDSPLEAALCHVLVEKVKDAG